jgi:hypothetical protein
MNKKVFSWIVFLLAINSMFASAHQPRMVFEAKTTIDNPVIIPDPQVSKAYYGELRGAPDYFIINSDSPFPLYVNILTPDIAGFNRTDFSVEVRDGNGVIALLDGGNSSWKIFYEEFGQDYYVQGPETRLNVSAGTYRIKVYSSDNTGRYSLAVGEEESFPPGEIINTLIIVPQIKQRFFNKSLIEAYMNSSGMAILIILVLLLAVVFVFNRLRKRKKKAK